MARIYAREPIILRDPPERLSWSQVARLAPQYKYACARSWGYMYLAKLPFEASSALVAGDAFDSGVNAFYSARMQGHPNDRVWSWTWRAVKDVWRERLPELAKPLSRREVGRYLNANRLALRLYTTVHADVIPAAVQTKHTYTVRTSDGDVREVRGYSDWIEQDGTIIDNKYVGTKPWDDKTGEWDQAWLHDKGYVDQLCCYWLARKAEATRGVPQPAPVVPRARLDVTYMKVNLKKPQFKSHVIEFTAEDEARVLGAIRQADSIIKDGRLPARPGDTCGFCSYRDRCRDDEARHGARFLEVVG